MKTQISLLFLLLAASLASYKLVTNSELVTDSNDEDIDWLTFKGMIEGMSATSDECSEIQTCITEAQISSLAQAISNELQKISVNMSEPDKYSQQAGPVYLSIVQLFQNAIKPCEKTAEQFLNFLNEYATKDASIYSANILQCINNHIDDINSIVQEIGKAADASEYERFGYYTGELIYIQITGGSLPPTPTPSSAFWVQPFLMVYALLALL